MHRGVVQVAAYGAERSAFDPFARPPTGASRGSAFFVRVRGVHKPVMLTCAHVIQHASVTKVVLPSVGRREIPVSVVAVCERHDIAMLMFTDVADAETVPPDNALELGNDHDVPFGATLHALGFPLGMNQVKTMKCTFNGIQNGMQIDCAINGGHSGGPLLYGDTNSATNKSQKVVGWVTSGIDPKMANSTSYAAPISHYYSVQDQFERAAAEWTPGAPTRIVHAPSLGILYHNGSEALRTAECDGVVIYYAMKRSPLSEYVRPGCKLCSFGFTSRHEPTGYFRYEVDYTGMVRVPWYIEKIPLKYVIAEIAQDQVVDVSIACPPRTGNSTGRIENVQIKLRTDVDVAGYRSYMLSYEPLEHIEVAGLVMMPLAANHRHTGQFATLHALRPSEIETPWVVVTLVVPGSEADHLGAIEAGDIVADIDGEPVHSLRDVRDAVAQARDRPLRITERGGRSVTVRCDADSPKTNGA